jgi:hypothetical protein
MERHYVLCEVGTKFYTSLNEFQSLKESHWRRGLEPALVHVDLLWTNHHGDRVLPCHFHPTSSPVGFLSSSSELPESGHI